MVDESGMPRVHDASWHAEPAGLYFLGVNIQRLVPSTAAAAAI